MTIGVTGPTGFVGRHVLAALDEAKRDYVCLVRGGSGHENLPPHSRILNYADGRSVEQALEGISVVLHIAGRINGSREDLLAANVQTMQALLRAAKKSGVRKMVYVSSAAAAYRRGPYGQTKWQAEEILKNSGLPYLILRPTLLYGVGDTRNVATMMRIARYSPVVPLLGGGKFCLQPLYIEDMTSVLLPILDTPLTDRVYNLAGPAQISLKDMLLVLAENLGKKPLLVPVPLKPFQAVVRFWSILFPRTRLPVKQILEMDKHHPFDITEAQRDFGFSPRTFREGIQSMVGRMQPCAA